jgi:hypothetical protein
MIFTVGDEELDSTIDKALSRFFADTSNGD